jgi:hypothetical protein
MATKTLKALELAPLLKVYPKEFKAPNGVADPTKIALRTTGGDFGQKMLTAFVGYVMKLGSTPAAVPLTILGYKHEPNGIVLGKAYNWVFFDKDSLEALTIEVDEADKLVFPPEPAMPKHPAKLTVINGIEGSVEEEEDAAEQLKAYFLKTSDAVTMAKLYQEFVAEQGLVAAFAEFVQDATDTDFKYEVESDEDNDDEEDGAEDPEPLDDDLEDEEEEDDGEGAE